MIKISRLTKSKYMAILILVVSVSALFLSAYAIRQKQLIDSSARTTEGVCMSSSECPTGYRCDVGYCVPKKFDSGGGSNDERTVAGGKLGKACKALGGNCQSECGDNNELARIGDPSKGNDCSRPNICCLNRPYERASCDQFGGTCRIFCGIGNGEILLDDVNDDGVSEKPTCNVSKGKLKGRCCYH